MQALRNMKQDRVTAWLVAGLLAYLLLLQGTVSAFAKAAMAADSAGPAFIICAPSGEDYSEGTHPLAEFAHDCCSSVCQLACSVGPAALPVAELLAPTLPLLAPLRAKPAVHGNAPGELGLTSDARAPPSSSS
jgi:hypothetical protein